MYQDILTKTGFFSKLASKVNKETLQFSLIALIFLLVAAGAFGLGRLSGLEEGRGRIGIYAPQSLSDPTNATAQLATPVAAPGTAPTGAGVGEQAAHNFVASKTGSKYYPTGCARASRIKAANQVWFASANDADAAGYTLASGCAAQ